MKTKKLFLTSILSILLVVAAVFGITLLDKNDGTFKGIYSGDFTVCAEEQTSVMGATKYLTSTNKDYMLITTSLKITDFNAYSAVGYEILRDGTALDDAGLNTNNIYTGITIKTGATTSKTWTMDQIFDDETGVTGMIVAEIAYSDYADFNVKPFVILVDGQTKEYGTTCGVVQEKTTTRFEMEAANIPSGSKLYVGHEGKPLADVDYPSGDAYVGNFNYVNTGFTVSMNITSDVDQVVMMSMSCGRGTYDAYMYMMFELKVNGETITVSDDVVWEKWVDGEAGIGHKYYSWVKKDVVRIPLKAGDNLIEFIKPVDSGNTPGTYDNVDYIELTGAGNVAWTSELDGTHAYGAWELYVHPTATTAGEIRRYCVNCRDTQIFALPAISVENGWTKICSGVQSTYTYEKDGQVDTYSVEEDVTATTYTFMAGSENDPFLAENGCTLTNVVGPTTSDKYGGPFYEKSEAGNDSIPEAGVFTFTVNVSEATVVNFYMNFIGKNTSTWDAIFTDITVNGSSEGVARTTGSYTSPGSWYTKDSKMYQVATLVLQAGTNVITLTRGTFNLNIDGIAFEAVVPVYLGPAA